MELPPFLCYEAGTDYIRLTGHRIALKHVVELYVDGYSAEMIVGYFPTLGLAHVHKVIAFYLEKRAEVDAYVAALQAAAARQMAEADKIRRAPTLEELRHRMAVRDAAAH